MKDEVRKIVENLRFHIIEIIRDDRVSGYFISHGKILDQDILLRVVPKNEHQKTDNIEKEAIVDKIIDRHNAKFPKNIIIKPKVLALGETTNFVWITRDYLQATTLGKIDKRMKLHGYDTIQNKYLDNKEETVDRIVSKIKDFRKIIPDFAEQKKDQSRFVNRFKSDIDQYDLSWAKRELGVDIDNLLPFYRGNYLDYCAPKNQVVNTGDLLPCNIMDASGELIFFDLEFFGLDNYMFDVAFLWLFLWRYRDWQTSLLKEMVRTKSDEDHFRASIIRSLVGWYSEYIFNPKDQITTSVIRRRNFFSKFVWTRYLAAAGESYEKLINTK